MFRILKGDGITYEDIDHIKATLKKKGIREHDPREILNNLRDHSKTRWVMDIYEHNQFSDIEEIKQNVLDGKKVYWGNESYIIECSGDKFWKVCLINDHVVGFREFHVKECFTKYKTLLIDKKIDTKIIA